MQLRCEGHRISSVLDKSKSQIMKKSIVCLMAPLFLTMSVLAGDFSDKLTEVHLCCQGCVKGVQKAVGQVPGVTAAADMDDGTVTLTGPDSATVQKAADAIVAAGYFGKSSDPAIKIVAQTGAQDQKVKSLEVEGVHLCCGRGAPMSCRGSVLQHPRDLRRDCGITPLSRRQSAGSEFQSPIVSGWEIGDSDPSPLIGL